MEMSVFLAKWIGLYSLIIAALWMVRREQFEVMVKEILSNKGVVGLLGIMDLLFGLAIILIHPYWELNWRGLITLIGLLCIVRGIIRFACPSCIEHLATSLLTKSWLFIGILIIIGLYLTYFGFTTLLPLE